MYIVLYYIYISTIIIFASAVNLYRQTSDAFQRVVLGAFPPGRVHLVLAGARVLVLRRG